MNMKYNKKAQIAGQIFVYAIAVVVVGLIIVYGYSAIKGFRERGEAVEFITLKTNLENSIKSVASDYGSIKRPDFRVPAKYTSICFVDKENYDVTSELCSQNSVSIENYWPIACAGWESGRNNVFLIPDGSEAFDVGLIKIVNQDASSNLNYVCVPVINGKLKLQLKGLGDRVQISMYE